jgi:hypothetical protein
MPQNEGALSAAVLATTTIVMLTRGPAQSGLWAGASALLNPQSLPALAAMSLRRGKRYAAIALIVALAVCAPWMARNWVELGAPYFIRDTFGLVLSVSNNDEAQPEVAASKSWWYMSPTYNVDEAALVAALGEGPYDHLRRISAMNWIRTHPTRFLQLCVGRAFYYWFPSSREGWTSYGYRLIGALGIVGAWLSRKNAQALTLAAGAVVYSLSFVVFQTDVKYSFPMLWASALLAGCAINAGCRRWLPDSNN